MAETGSGLAHAEAVHGRHPRTTRQRRVRRHPAGLEPLKGTGRLPNPETARAAEPNHRDQLEPRRHRPGPVLRMRHRLRERRVPRSSVDRHRPVASRRDPSRVALAQAVRHLRRDPPPDRHPPANRPWRTPQRAHSRFPGAVCRQRWTVRLGEVEPVFGQTGRVVLDITARTAHDGALKWTRAPSTPRAARSILRNIPVHLRTALRRALEFEARAPAPRSAEEAEQCEEQLRAIADEFFGALLTPVLQRAVRSAAVGDAASALVRHLPRRMRSDGLETVNVRTSRGTTVPVTTPYYREKHARRAKRRPGLYPGGVARCRGALSADRGRARVASCAGRAR